MSRYQRRNQRWDGFGSFPTARRQITSQKLTNYALLVKQQYFNFLKAEASIVLL